MEVQFFFSTKALIIKENKFLALYKNIDGKQYWDLPGGRMEFGENAEETLKREIQEELGVHVNPIKLIDTWNHVRDNNFHIAGVVYYCQLESNDIRLSDEHDGYEWIDINHYSKVFKAKDFLDRMHRWDWDAIVSDKNKVVHAVEELDISKIIPNNLYLNQTKLETLRNSYIIGDSELFPPILVGIIDDELSLIDGHSRTWVAHEMGMTKMKAIVKPIDNIRGPELLYRRIHEIAKENNIRCISDLSNRILTDTEHKEKWVGFCSGIIKELNL